MNFGVSILQNDFTVYEKFINIQFFIYTFRLILS